MGKPKTPYKDADTQLLLIGLHSAGFEKYAGDDCTVEGLRGSDYRWALTMTKTGKRVECSTLGEVIEKIRVYRSGSL